jgi:glycosyltransferase involved in cell wall biosynthesis
MKVNWFSPLPPARTGVACYATHVIEALAKEHELVLWTSQADVERGLARSGRIVRFEDGEPPWRALNDADLSLYHIGNNAEFHGDILAVSRQSAGVVVLHDLRLHDMLFMLSTHVWRDPAKYLEMMERWYGDEGLRAAKAFRAGGLSPQWMSQKFPLTREAAVNATGVVTHYDALDAMDEMPACPWVWLPHPYAAMDEAAYAKVRALRARRQSPPFRLLVFGFLGRNRRVDVILQAFAQVRERRRFHLDVCGELWDGDRIRALIRELGLGDQVSLNGFLSDQELHERLIDTDLALNLRYPSMGEASGSQCRIWDYGIPSLVTQTEWYASLPPNAVGFVRTDYEMDDIREHLEAFLGDPKAYAGKGENGRRELRNYDPARYADAVLRFAAESRHYASRLAALSLAERTGNEAGRWLAGDSAPPLFDRIEKEIYAAFAGPERNASSAAATNPAGR